MILLAKADRKLSNVSLANVNIKGVVIVMELQGKFQMLIFVNDTFCRLFLSIPLIKLIFDIQKNFKHYNDGSKLIINPTTLHNLKLPKYLL